MNFFGDPCAGLMTLEGYAELFLKVFRNKDRTVASKFWVGLLRTLFKTVFGPGS